MNSLADGGSAAHSNTEEIYIPRDNLSNVLRQLRCLHQPSLQTK